MTKLNQKQTKELKENVGILICQIGEIETITRINSLKMTDKDFSTLSANIEKSKGIILENAKIIINEKSYVPHHLEWVEKK